MNDKKSFINIIFLIFLLEISFLNKSFNFLNKSCKENKREKFFLLEMINMDNID